MFDGAYAYVTNTRLFTTCPALRHDVCRRRLLSMMPPFEPPFCFAYAITNIVCSTHLLLLTFALFDFKH